MPKKSALQIVQALKAGFTVRAAAVPVVAPDVVRSVAQSKDAEALLIKYLGKNSPVTAAAADSSAADDIETIEVSSPQPSADGSVTRKKVFVSNKKQQIIAEQG